MLVVSLTSSGLKQWADEYGSVYSLKVGQSTLVVLNDRRAVHELLSLKGANNNDRPVDDQISLSTGGEFLSFMPEGSLWRAQRKITASYFSPKNLDTAMRGIQEFEYVRY